MNADGPESERPLVLVVDDEREMRKLLRVSLTAHGYQVLEAETGTEALQLVASRNPALVVLDLGLPDVDGVSVTRAIREWSRTPVVVLSARGREADKVEALDAGADDYLTKPFGVNELLARLRVARRHAETLATDAPDAPRIELGDVTIDLARREVIRGGERLHLTPIEYRLLTLLARNAGKVLTHRQILREVWGPSYVAHTHYVRVRMAELRKKLEPDPARPRLLMTEPGVGYRLQDPVR